MGQPNPPGDIPLIEGLDSSWNEFVDYIPEDKRAEFAPKFKERISSIESQYEPLKQWEDFQKSGITPDHVNTALGVFSTIENDPKQIYDLIGQHLNITPAQAQAVVEDLEENGPSEDPRLSALQQQVELMSQIMVGQRQQTVKEQQAAQMDAQIDSEISSVMQKLGEVPENQLIMRMQIGMTAEEAHNDYTNMVSEIQKRRPAPMIMGSGGAVPSRAIDPKKLNGKETRSIVAQMLDAANSERNNS